MANPLERLSSKMQFLRRSDPEQRGWKEIQIVDAAAWQAEKAARSDRQRHRWFDHEAPIGSHADLHMDRNHRRLVLIEDHSQRVMLPRNKAVNRHLCRC